MGKIRALLIFAAVFGPAVIRAADGEVAPPAYQLVISVAEQKLAVVRDGGLVRKYPISTSKFGLGDSFNSYRTPLGHLKVCDKIGDDLPIGAVLKSRNATGEILPANAPGRDPIVTRIMWLEGLDSCNTNARSRGIYIHGTVEESKLGQPVSYGCIRMRSRDVVELFDDTPVGAPVQIISDKLPQFRKPAPKTETLIATANDTVTTTTVGPRGMVIVRTTRNTSVAVAKSTPAPAAVEATKLAANKPLPKSADPAPPTKTAEAPAKLVAKTAPALPPVGAGPTVIFTATLPAAKLAAAAPAPAADQPRVVFNMAGSILMSDLAKQQPVAPAAAPQPALKLPTSRAAQLLALDLGTLSFSLLADAPPVPAADAFTRHLLNPPVPPLRLAFRSAAAAKPEL